MEGREVFRQAVQRLSEVVDEALHANDLTAADIDWLVPHQANSRIIDGMGRKLGLPQTKDRHDDRSPRQHFGRFDPARPRGGGRRRRIKPGDLVLMEALGGGLSWGASLVRW